MIVMDPFAKRTIVAALILVTLAVFVVVALLPKLGLLQDELFPPHQLERDQNTLSNDSQTKSLNANNLGIFALNLSEGWSLTPQRDRRGDSDLEAKYSIDYLDKSVATIVCGTNVYGHQYDLELAASSSTFFQIGNISFERKVLEYSLYGSSPDVTNLLWISIAPIQDTDFVQSAEQTCSLFTDITPDGIQKEILEELKKITMIASY